MIGYRLQINLGNGVMAFSPTVQVGNTPLTGRLSLQPSVTQQGATTLYIGSAQVTSFNLNIVDASGRILPGRSMVVRVSQGDNYIPLDLAGFPRGIYYVHITGGGGFRKTLTLERL